jgi:hypothetical protein
LGYGIIEQESKGRFLKGRGPTHKSVIEALKSTAETGSLTPLFVDVLRWEPPTGSESARLGELSIGASENCVISGQVHLNSRSLILTLRDRTKDVRMRISLDNPSEESLDRLSLMAMPSVAAEGGVERMMMRALRDAFHPSESTEAFLNEYEKVFKRHVDKVLVITSAGGRRSKKMEPEQARWLFLQRFLNRVLLVRLLEDKGWFQFDGRLDYLAALYDDWSSNPGPYAFYQRLALVFFNALSQPSAEARALLRPQVGEVPYLGRGLFTPELFEREFASEEGLGVIPDEMFEDLLGPRGLLRRREFTSSEGVPEVLETAVSPEVLSHLYSQAASRSGEPVGTSEQQRSSRAKIADQLGISQNEPTLSRSQALALIHKLGEVHIYDAPCGTGTKLVASLTEMIRVYELAQKAADQQAESSSVVARRLLNQNLKGLDQDDLSVQTARFRLALAVLGLDNDKVPRPLPDLSQVIMTGQPLRSEQKLTEGPMRELKAAFEWSTLDQKPNKGLRHGCLRTVAAFLNSDGGELLIGVDDAGEPVGLEGDYSLQADANSRDGFEGRFREAMKNHLEPMPLNAVRVEFEDRDGRDICVVKVEPQAGVTYLVRKDPKNGQMLEEIYVRDGNRTLNLSGRSRDQFILTRRA